MAVVLTGLTRGGRSCVLVLIGAAMRGAFVGGELTVVCSVTVSSESSCSAGPVAMITGSGWGSGCGVVCSTARVGGRSEREGGVRLIGLVVVVSKAMVIVALFSL